MSWGWMMEMYLKWKRRIAVMYGRVYNLLRGMYPAVGSELFVDTNIFIFVFFQSLKRNISPSSFRQSHHYYRHYGYLHDHGYVLHTNYDVITEIVGVMMHDGYDHYRSTISYSRYREFKDFRDGVEGQRLSGLVCDIIHRDILSHVSILDKVFDINDIRRFIVPDNLDCTDKAILSICKAYDVILFTDDRDFRHTSIPLLTRNSTILSTAAPVVPLPPVPPSSSSSSSSHPV
jgi:predicted nucleic acid-binding protein